MRNPPRELALVIGAVAVLSAVFTVLAGIYVNFATDGRPELNPAHILPAILFACLAAVLPPLGGFLQSRWANRTATATDPFTAHDLPTFKRLLKDLRREASTPRFAELQARAARRGLAFDRADLEKVTKQGAGWLTDAERAEPVIRAFLLVHDVPDAAADKWLQSYRRLADPRPAPPARRTRLVVGIVVSVAFATAAFLTYVVYVDTHVPDSLKRSNVTILSLYASGKPLVVSTSTTAPPHARLGGSAVDTVPGAAQRWDLEPDKRDGTFFYRIRNRLSERCLTPEARRVTEGIFLTEAACDDSDDQLWRLTGDHAIAISSPQGDLCAEPNQSTADSGTPLVLLACAADRPGQRWLVTARLPDLGSSLASAENGRCLDATGTTDLIMWGCHGGVNQAFGYQRNARGEYAITSMGGCLAATGPTDRRRPARESCSGSAGQLWRFTYRSAYNRWHYWEVQHVASGLCLEMEPARQSVSLRPCTRANVQQWRTPDWLNPPNTPAHPQ
ncbi:RICIN domain-containing protein [Nonomuraea sp. NEAU-A123]|uniref:RICIN domain-containing protein n=1 Tax=Nonomuraea sp. NEAU-A123 TaxID=2839649 RepID=UPI001BE4C5ED|nr:ricin-type beta-trefoil lectin domain protein [Nonomuraea sp. NEAU-A123]MBT2231981.1 RICIN domain-containing protein [Nonomuraea sp. NEAU-A123]